MKSTDGFAVVAVQVDLAWENPTANHDKIETLLKNCGRADLIVLPEMFTTGFSMTPAQIAEEHGAEMESLEWMQKTAHEHNSCVAGSIAVSEGDLYFNRLYFVYPDGNFTFYDKRQLFNLAGEGKSYQSGSEAVVAEYKGWGINLNVCYDLRFPEVMRNGWQEGEADFDLQIVVANWPKPRRAHWLSLLQARGVENQCYVVGCNRVGQDSNGLEYVGDSAVFSYTSERLGHLGEGKEGLISAVLHKEELDTFREKLPFLADA